MVAEMVRERLRGEGSSRFGGRDPSRNRRCRSGTVSPRLQRLRTRHRPFTRCRLGCGGLIQFVSYLILNLNVLVIDVEEGSLVGRAFVDLRGNTERSWRRATDFLLDNVLLEQLRGKS